MTKQALLDFNCMEGDLPPPGSTFYVPYITIAEEPNICSPRIDWINYIVRPGDTLFSLAKATNTSVSEIQNASCYFSNTIYPNMILKLPYYPIYIPPTPPPVPTYNPPTQPPPPTDPPPEPTNGNISKRTDMP
jgi:hypothetical protein